MLWISSRSKVMRFKQLGICWWYEKYVMKHRVSVGECLTNLRCTDIDDLSFSTILSLRTVLHTVCFLFFCSRLFFERHRGLLHHFRCTLLDSLSCIRLSHFYLKCHWWLVSWTILMYLLDSVFAGCLRTPTFFPLLIFIVASIKP